MAVVVLSGLGGLAYSVEMAWRAEFRNPNASPARIHAIGRQLYFNGVIKRGDDERLARAYADSWLQPDTFVVNSGGGATMAAIGMGRFIRQHGMKVEVIKNCFSSCANYLFPAGSKIILHASSALGWHGGARSRPRNFALTIDGQEASEAETAKYMQTDPEFLAWRKAEEGLFRALGIGALLPVCGQTDSFVASALRDENIGLFDYRVADLRRFGVRNIQFTDGEEAWERNQRERKIYRAHYCERQA
jgi:hypothetical protein